MKIAIVTITRGENYGNRLQNYALQFQLKKYCDEVETIHNHCGENRLVVLIKKLLKSTFFIKKYKYKIKREKSFDSFNISNIYFSKYHLNNKNVNSSVVNNYDYFVCGSDQIWNPSYQENNRLNFLADIPKDKSISYAASFGVSSIPDLKKKNFKQWLINFKYISVRETKGKEIVEELTGRKDVEVLVDPTMLLTKEEWDNIALKPKMLKNNKYILNYFLGDLSDERREKIDNIAKENNCYIINILDKDDPFYTCGPSEFLYLEKNAFLICTDSFHSSVFGIIYHTPFIVFDREQNGTNSMSSRIDTLLSKFNMESRKYNGKIDNNIFDIDFKYSDKILEEEKRKTEAFLKKAFEIKDSE